MRFSVHASAVVPLLCFLAVPGPLAGAARAAATPGPGPVARAEPEAIAPNDNRQPAGRLENGVLTIRLEARAGLWRPDGPQGGSAPVYAWGEEGRPLQNPGPFIRVPAGTEIHATIHNSLEKPLSVFGLDDERSVAGAGTVVRPGETREFRFHAPSPGTYYYAAKTDTVPLFAPRTDDSQLNGALVVDPPGQAGPPNDRVFVISIWGYFDRTSPTGLGKATMAINGLSWPHTERIDASQGDSLHWRWINASFIPHPMHLHGFYFRVDGQGDGAHDAAFPPDQRRMAVTQVVDPGRTMAMTWSPNRPGDWIFHCHFAGHLSPSLVALDTDRGVTATHAMLMRHPSDAPHHMAGLVLGIRVKPNGALAKAAPSYRPIRLLVREKPKVYGDHPGYAFVLGGTPEADRPDALVVPGPTLVLEKDQPVAVTIVNQAQEPAAVHWHGIELESFPDGVPGWSGWGSNILQEIQPRDSFTVRFTPPRAGTFMYHSHFDEFQQISSGLYGAIVVLDRGTRFDPETDRILLLSDGGPTVNVIDGPFPPTFLNGSASPPPMELRAGTTYRLRLINIRSEPGNIVSLLNGDKPVEWRAVAKDGADLPPAQATVRPATLRILPGEIYDFEFTPKTAGELTLQFRDGAPPNVPEPPWTRVPVHVR